MLSYILNLSIRSQNHMFERTEAFNRWIGFDTKNVIDSTFNIT